MGESRAASVVGQSILKLVTVPLILLSSDIVGKSFDDACLTQKGEQLT